MTIEEKEKRDAHEAEMARNAMEERILTDIKTVMGTKSGRRLWFHILKFGGFCTDAFIPAQAELTQYVCGKQSVAHYMWELVVRADKGLAVKMMAENLTALYEYGQNYNHKEVSNARKSRKEES